MIRLKNRWLFLIGVFLLGGVYFFPLWKISIAIPQYPKEIGIHIWISKIENASEKAMEIMNVLNHNIGMKEINPDAVPELKFFPWILGILILLGVIIFIQEKRIFRLAYLVLTVILLSLALYDFYLWEYDYGHNLADDAPLKIENSSFQPPLIGQKTIANFIVRSVPMTGAVFPLVSTVTMLLTVIKEKRSQ
jgi:copper chaperone NosL